MKEGNTYVIDNESGAEMARLIDQERMITKAMDGLLPAGFQPTSGKTVLDLAWGPGGWTQEVAFSYPEMQIIGVDSSRKMVEHAQSLAQAQHIENLQFELADIRQHPLSFPDNSFDFINARMIIAFMFKEDWPQLAQECMRILQPGGTVRFTECDRASKTTSPAFEEMQDIFAWHGYRINRAYQALDVGITIRLSQFLRNAGCEHVQVQAHAIDWSIGTREWSIIRRNFEIAFKLMQPYAVQAGATDEQWSELNEQAQREFYEADFCALWNFVSAWGHKPT